MSDHNGTADAVRAAIRAWAQAHNMTAVPWCHGRRVQISVRGGRMVASLTMRPKAGRVTEVYATAPWAAAVIELLGGLALERNATKAVAAWRDGEPIMSEAYHTELNAIPEEGIPTTRRRR